MPRLTDSAYPLRTDLTDDTYFMVVGNTGSTPETQKAAGPTVRGYTTGTAPVRMVIPYYDYTSFNDVDITTIINNPSFSPVVIVNVSDGPGASVNTDYQHEIARMAAAGVTVVGYVVSGDVGSGPTASAATVEADVDKWYTWYASSGIAGIFFDLTPTGASGNYVSYCEQIAAYAHAKGDGQTVIFNPGTYPLQAAGYFDPADIVCVWEADWNAGAYLTMTVPSYAATWVQAAARSKMLHLVYNVTAAADMRAAMAKAVSVGARCFYCTSGGSLWTVLDSGFAAQATHAKDTAVALDQTDRREHHGPFGVADDGSANVKDFAAKGDGTADDTAAIQAALNSGAKNVWFPAGTYRAVGLNVPYGVSLRGASPSASEIKANGSGTILTVTSSGTPDGNRYGTIDNIGLNGNSQAATGLYVEVAVFRRFTNIVVRNCTTVGVRLDGTQNCTFQDVSMIGNAVAMIVLNGAGNNILTRCQFTESTSSTAGEANMLRFAAADNAFSGYAANLFSRVPTNNTFDRCIFEVSTATPDPIRVKIDSGKLIEFRSCDFGSLNTLAVHVTSTAYLTRLRNCYFGGDGATSDRYAILNDGWKTHVEDCYFEAFAANEAVVRTSNELIWSKSAFSDASQYVLNLSGSAALNIRAFSPAEYFYTQVTPPGVLNGGQVYYNDVGDVFFRAKDTTRLLVSWERATFSNAAYTIPNNTRYAAQTGTMSASRAVTLPAANAVPPGTQIVVVDESGTVTGTNTIVVTRAGTDTVNGGTTLAITAAYGSACLVSDGTSKWTGWLPPATSAAGGPLDMGSQRIVNVADPTSAQDASTKAYVDGVASGLDLKASVRAATTAALPASTYANGSSGVGATLTGNANGALAAQDGITLIANDRLLVKNQASGLQNGIYTLTTVGSGGTPFVLTRATDADTSAEVTTGMFTFVGEGTTLAGTGWTMTTAGTITIGTTAQTFSQFSAAGTGILPTIIDAKGDLIVGTAPDTPARFAAGTNGQLLVADSTQPAGLRWDSIANAVGLLVGTVTWDPPSLTSGATATTTITVAGAVVGDPVAGLGHTSITGAGWTWRSRVSSANTVSVELTNNTGGTVNLASGTLKCAVVH